MVREHDSWKLALIEELNNLRHEFQVRILALTTRIIESMLFLQKLLESSETHPVSDIFKRLFSTLILASELSQD